MIDAESAFNAVAYLAAGLGILGAILNANKMISGFYVWLIANACWIIVDVYKEIYAQAALFVFYSFLCFYGIYSWRKKD